MGSSRFFGYTESGPVQAFSPYLGKSLWLATGFVQGDSGNFEDVVTLFKQAWAPWRISWASDTSRLVVLERCEC